MNRAPTPGEFAMQLAAQYGPPPDPNNPFNDRQGFAARQLTLLAVSQTYGLETPIGRLAKLLAHLERVTHPLRPIPMDRDLSTRHMERLKAIFDEILQEFFPDAEES
ncbi:hypothetical protein [Palleronia sp.]|uniref:hypothetical protein n=1 Tax=Palleronia sp. TaxID=1940284 RepID=UPI0035C85BC9